MFNSMNGPEDRSLYGHGGQDWTPVHPHNFCGWVTGAMLVSLPGLLTVNVAPSASAVLFGIAGGLVTYGFFRRMQSRRGHSGHSPVFRNAVARPVAYPTLLSESSYWETYRPQMQNTPTWRIALVGARSQRLDGFARRLALLGCEVHQSNDPDAILAAMEGNPNAWSAVILDLPSHDDIRALAADARDFAAALPDLPLIMLDEDSQPKTAAALRDARITEDASLHTEMDNAALSQALNFAIQPQIAAITAS